MISFDQCLSIVLREEGGWVDDPQDPGGVTNLGVTRAVWTRWQGHAATDAEMRSLTPAQVSPLYRAQYWQAASCDNLPDGIALCVFDFAVNGGVGRAVRYLQEVVGATQDGHAGTATLQAVIAYSTAHGIQALISAYQSARIAFYRNLPDFQHFGKGWLARVEFVQKQAQTMV